MSARTRLLHAALVALIGLGSGTASAQSGDKNAEKAARRSQLMMQNLQQQLQDAQAAKAKVEADKAAADKQLGDQTKQLAQLKGALPRVSQSLKAAETERARLSASVAALEKQLADQKAATDTALAAKGREIEQLTKARDEQFVQSRRSLDERGTQVAECTSRNERLIRLNAELLDRYRGKTTADVLKQREPFLGFHDVEMFNIVQDYRDKADAERYSPPSTGETRPK